MNISRRTVLAGAGASVVLANPAAHALDLQSTDAAQDPKNIGRLYDVVRENGQNSHVNWASSGLIFFKPDTGILVPLMRFYTSQWAVNRKGADGRSQHLMEELLYFSDLQSGEIVDRWTNVQTGETHDVKHQKIRGMPMVITDVGAIEQPIWAQSFDGAIGPVRIQGGQLWMDENWSARTRAQPSASEPKTIHTLSTFIASASAAEARLRGETDFLDVTYSNNTDTPLEAWMGYAEDTPGRLIWTVQGHKMHDASRVPAKLAQRIDADHRGWLDGPQL